MPDKWDEFVEMVRRDGFTEQAAQAYQFIDLIGMYGHFLNAWFAGHGSEDDEQLVHVRTMFPKVVQFLENSIYLAEPEKGKNWSKANRWLGFIQGVFYSKGGIHH